MEVAFLMVVLGITISVVLGSSTKMGTSGPLGTFFGVLLIPVIIALLWKSAMLVGWWTIAVFIGLSLIAGFVIAPIRRNRPEALIQMQPLLGILSTGFAVAAWLV